MMGWWVGGYYHLFMKKVIIMGATSGLGLGLAEKYLQEGWSVGACGRNLDRLSELSARWPGKVIVRKIDITCANAADELLRLIEDMGGMDVYFHCSGVLPFNSSLDETKELMTVRTNVEGFTRMVSAAYRHFRDSNRAGKIIAITSIAGVRGVAQLASYCASKAYDSTYLEALRQMSVEQHLPLDIIDIRPGWIRTPLLAGDKRYFMEMTEEKAVNLIYKVAQRSRRGAIIGARWRLACALERIVLRCIWERLRLRQWE